MTQSEVPRRMSPDHNHRIRAGALSIGAFERSHWRLRRTRHLWVLNRLCGLWDRQSARCMGAESAVLTPQRPHQRSGAVEWDAFGFELGAFPPVRTHVGWACRSTLEFRD